MDEADVGSRISYEADFSIKIRTKMMWVIQFITGQYKLILSSGQESNFTPHFSTRDNDHF